MSLMANEKAFDGARTGQFADVLVCGCVTLILALGSASAIAASHLDINCMETAVLDPESDREALLDIDVVDLTTRASAEMPELRERDTTVPSDDTNAPHLYLGPRVATIVRDVFGEEEPDTDEALLDDEPELTRTTQLSPLAERTEPATETAEENRLDSDDAGYSPLRIHREMYRTDI